MAQLRHIPTDPEDLRYRPKVFFACHPEDHVVYFDEVVKQLQAFSHCAVYFYSPEDMVGQDAPFYEELDAMNLFVIPVTAKLLCQPNWAMDVLFPYAQRFPKPVLPLMMERGLEAKYDKKFGNLQFLDRCNEDPTVLPYEEKLKRYLQSKLVSDEQVKKIQSAFDAYVFLSYRKKDRQYAQQLMRLLHRDPVCRDIAIWYDEFLTPGENFNSTILEALQRSKLFALVVTPNVLEKPNYVLDPEYKCASEFGKPVLPAQMLQTDAAALRECCPNIPDAIDPTDESAITQTILEAMRGIALRENDKDPLHNFFIGLAYLNGIDVEVDHKRAVELITGAAETGLTEAMEKLVDMYETGDGVPRDYLVAIHWRELLTDKIRDKFERIQSQETAEAYLHHLWCLGDAFWYHTRQAAKAKDSFEAMRILAEKLVEQDATKVNLRYLSLSYDRTGYVAQLEGNNKIAKEWYNKALMIAERLATNGTRREKAELNFYYNRQFNIAKAEGNSAEMRIWFQKIAQNRIALSIRRDKESIFETARYQEYLGDIASAKGDIYEARTYYTLSTMVDGLDNLPKKIQEETRRRYEKLGDNYEHDGNQEMAEYWYNKAVKLAERLAQAGTLGDYEGLASSCYKLGKMCRDVKMLEKAEQNYIMLAKSFPKMNRYDQYLQSIKQIISALSES